MIGSVHHERIGFPSKSHAGIHLGIRSIRHKISLSVHSLTPRITSIFVSSPVASTTNRVYVRFEVHVSAQFMVNMDAFSWINSVRALCPPGYSASQLTKMRTESPTLCIDADCGRPFCARIADGNRIKKSRNRIMIDLQELDQYESRKCCLTFYPLRMSFITFSVLINE